MPLLPGQENLGAIKTYARQLADMEDSQFVSDDELVTYINSGLYALYDLLVMKFGNDYYMAPPIKFITDGVTDRYLLPDGSVPGVPAFYKLAGVDIMLGPSPDSWVTLRPFNFIDRNRFAFPNIQTVYGAANLRYRLSGNYLWLTPRAMSGQSIQVWYIPRLIPLVNDSDLIDDISGWSEYVAIYAASRMKQKQEDDMTTIAAMLAQVEKRIEDAAANRDVGSPATTGDTLWKNFGSFSGAWGSGGGGGMGY
jgi:hypothetical protein